MKTIENISLSRRALLFGRNYSDDQSGATTIEYGMIAALVALPLLAVSRQMGKPAQDSFGLDKVSAALNGSDKKDLITKPGGATKSANADKATSRRIVRRDPPAPDCKPGAPTKPVLRSNRPKQLNASFKSAPKCKVSGSRP